MAVKSLYDPHNGRTDHNNSHSYINVIVNKNKFKK